MSSYPCRGSKDLWSQAALRLRSDGDEVAASVLWWPQLSPRVVRLPEEGITLFVVRPQISAFANQGLAQSDAALVISPVAFETSSGLRGGPRPVLSGEFLCSAKSGRLNFRSVFS